MPGSLVRLSFILARNKRLMVSKVRVKKSVSIHPILNGFVRKVWAKLVEKGYRANYSTALNFMLLMAVQLSRNVEVSEETLKALREYINDGSIWLKQGTVKAFEEILEKAL